MKRIIALFICAVMTACLIFPSKAVFADGATPTDVSTATDAADPSEMRYDETKGIAAIRVMFCTETGARDIIKTGCAFFIGSGDDVYLITSASTVLLTDAEKQAVADSHAVEKDKVKTAIELVYKEDIVLDLSVVNSSETLDFAILQPSKKLAGVTKLRLSEESSGYGKGSAAHAYSRDVVQIKCTIEDWTEISDAHFLKYTSDYNVEKGIPIINDDGEVIAIAGEKNKGNPEEKYALLVDEVIDVLTLLGIEYNEPIVVDSSKLEQAFERFETLEEKDYTPESWKKCMEARDNAKKILDKINDGEINKYTQTEADDASRKFVSAMDALEEKGISVKQVVILAIIGGALLLIAIIVLIVVLVLKTGKYKKKLKEEGDTATLAKEALMASGRVTPGTLPNNTNRVSASNMGQGMDQGPQSFETTVLMSDLGDSDGEYDFENVPEYPTLMRLKTGEGILINQNSFVIGSGADFTDYCLKGNTNISRKHVCIMKFEDGYYIQDLDTTNGTFVNEMRVMPGRYVKLVNGYTVRMAEEEFEFRQL